MSDQQSREAFFAEHSIAVSVVAEEAARHPGDDRVVVLCDLNDESGVTFVTFSSNHGKDSVEVGSVWAAHFNKRVLAMLLDYSWPAVKEVIAALRSDADYEHMVLVIANGGAQLRCYRAASGAVA